MVNLSTVNAIPTLTSNTIPSGVASANSIASSAYDAWKAFDGLSSTYWRTLSGNPVGSYLSYEFPNKKLIGGYSITVSPNTDRFPKSWLFQGSNDNSTWDTLDTRNTIAFTANEKKSFVFNNTSEYKSYRLSIQESSGSTTYMEIAELEMFEIMFLNKFLISSNDETYSLEYTKSFKEQYPPDMTSNTVPSPYVASASSEYNTNTNGAWRAFNSNTTTTDNQSWSSISGSLHWLMIDLGLGNEKVIQGFHIHAYRFAGTGYPPNKVTLQGSNDNTNFDDLYEYIPDVATWNNKIVYEFDNDKSYRYYKLLMPTPSSTRLMIRDWRLYEYDDYQKVINLSSSNESNLVKYGLNKGRKIDFTLPMTSKSYILQDSVALGSGKVFSKKITRDIIKAQIK